MGTGRVRPWAIGERDREVLVIEVITDQGGVGAGLAITSGMAALPDDMTNITDGAETTLEGAEVPRCARCQNRTGPAGALWLGFHGLWCLRCFSNHLVELLS
jgi:hypothetical protein